MNLLNYDELSKKISVKKSTLYAWVSQNKIPSLRFSNRCVRFNEEDIFEWIEEKQKQYGVKK